MTQGKKRPKYPLPCPVCRNAMIGEKTSPDAQEYDKFVCLNCGAIVLREDSAANDREA